MKDELYSPCRLKSKPPGSLVGEQTIWGGLIGSLRNGSRRFARSLGTSDGRKWDAQCRGHEVALTFWEQTLL